jgi:L-threonylcarbamoyladenylate synthase
MTTRILKIDPSDVTAQIADAISILRSGGLVAFPTETVYGLGANAMNADAVARVFEAKGRPSDNPLIVHLASPEQIEQFGVEISPTALTLASSFWPGPLTIVVKSRGSVPGIVRAGLDTVALRIPRHPVPLALAAGLGGGLVGPSANRSGRPSPTTARHVFDDLDGRIDLILDSGPTTIGVESTVIDLTSDPPAILRFGGLSREEIEAVVGPVAVAGRMEDRRKSPGTRHRHYAPKATVFVVPEGNSERYAELLDRFVREGKQIGCIIHSSVLSQLKGGDPVHLLPSDHASIARRLFSCLRECDEAGVDVILVEGVSELGLGKAIMDRIRRAAE